MIVISIGGSRNDRYLREWSEEREQCPKVGTLYMVRLVPYTIIGFMGRGRFSKPHCVIGTFEINSLISTRLQGNLF